jgi:hypothetical protein
VLLFVKIYFYLFDKSADFFSMVGDIFSSTKLLLFWVFIAV